MPDCPNCNTPLQTAREADGVYHYCGGCQGYAVAVSRIRRHVGERFTSALLRQVNTATEVSSRTCPFCLTPMKQFVLTQPPLPFKSCKTCSMIWFETGQFERLVAGASEVEAQWKIEQEKSRRQELLVYGQMPKEWWKWIPAYLGMPIKYDNANRSQWPWALWSLSAIVTATSITAFFHEKWAIETFGLITSEPFRYGGLTFLTAFFIHAGVFHLVSNLYFFLLFGGEVEHFLGHRRFLVLVFLATIVGNGLEVLFNFHSHIIGFGASGGIAGVLVFYALQFPWARLAFLFRTWFRLIWVEIPALVAIILWLLLQLIGAYVQSSSFGHSGVGYLTHIGGAATGFVLWWYWRKLKPNPAPGDAS